MIIDQPPWFPFKALKRDKITYVQEKYILNKLPPMPIVRRSIPNSKKLRRKLVIEGHKYFDKVVVSGEETEFTLKKLQKTKCLKCINSFEFDPYFCNKSCIKPMVKLLPKLRETKKANLIIRRFFSLLINPNF